MSDGQVLACIAFATFMGFVVQRLASRKGYENDAWGILGFVCWPLALLMLASKPNLRFRRCADCGSTDVPFDVPVCKHCGRDERTVVRT